MLEAIVKNGILSHVTTISLEEGEDVPRRAAARYYMGRLKWNKAAARSSRVQH